MMIDQAESWHRGDHRVLYRAHVVALEEDDVTSPSGELLRREFCSHPGSVAVLALDDQARVAVVHQYRHPVQTRLVELPAGLLDVPGEAPLAGAQRELAEEAGLAADDWAVLADFCSSPGISDEVTRIYLARRLHQRARPDGFDVQGEEVDMGLAWVPLDDLLDVVRAGAVCNTALVLGVTTLRLAMADGVVDALRPGDTPWPMHDRVQQLKTERGDA